MIETIDKALAMFASEPNVTVQGAAQRLGMHLVANELAVTFTPRDREFAHGSAVRQWHKESLGVIILDVDVHQTLKYSVVRDAFGPFKASTRQHPGDSAVFVAYPTVGASKILCMVSVTLRTLTEEPTGEEAVSRIEVTR